MKNLFLLVDELKSDAERAGISIKVRTTDKAIGVIMGFECGWHRVIIPFSNSDFVITAKLNGIRHFIEWARNYNVSNGS